MQAQHRRGGVRPGSSKAGGAQAKASAEAAKLFWTALPLGKKCRVLHFDEPKLVERAYVIQQMLWYSELLCHRSGVRVRDGAADSRNLALEAFEFKWPTTRPRIPYQAGPHGQTSPVAFAVRAEFLQREDLLEHIGRIATGFTQGRTPRDDWPSVFEPTPNAWSDYERQVFKLVEIAILDAASAAVAAEATAPSTPDTLKVAQPSLATVKEASISEVTTPKKKARRKKKGASKTAHGGNGAPGTVGVAAPSNSGCSVREGPHSIQKDKQVVDDKANVKANNVEDKDDEDEEEDDECVDVQKEQEEQEEQEGQEEESEEEVAEDEEDEDDEADEEEEKDEEEEEESDEEESDDEESKDEESGAENVVTASAEAAPVVEEHIPCTAQEEEEAHASSSWEMVSRKKDRRARPAAMPSRTEASTPLVPRSASGPALPTATATSDGSTCSATHVGGHHVDPLLGSSKSAASSEAPTAAPAQPSSGHSRQSSSSRASAASTTSSRVSGDSPSRCAPAAAFKPPPDWSPVWCPNGLANEDAEWRLITVSQTAHAEDSEIRAVVRRTFLDVEPVPVDSSLRRRARSLDRW